MATPIPLNRCAFTAAEIAAATGAARPANTESLRATGVSIDSRTAAPGALFVALQGVRDGHDFIATAAHAGAVAAIVERGRAHPALPCFEVADSLTALGAMAGFHLDRMRRAQALPTIAVGGAAGKTTTKELTAAVMRAVCGETLATPGNLNNLIGVPMTIFTLDERHRAAVLECGTNRRGEIARLAAIVRPDAALVLNVDIEHTESLGSLEGVADEEAALFGTATCAVVSTAEAMLLGRVPAGLNQLTFGIDSAADVRLLDRAMTGDGFQKIRISLRPDLVDRGVAPTLTTTLRLLGATSAINATAAVAAAVAALARPLREAELAAIATTLSNVAAVDGRLKVVKRAGVVVLDDTYNSNPRSLRAALTAGRELAEECGARLIVAIGDMLELGDLSATMHTEAVRDIFAVGPAACILVGPAMSAAAAQLPAGARPPELQTAVDSTTAAQLVTTLIRAGDVLLVKGSRGMAMEQIIAALPASALLR